MFEIGSCRHFIWPVPKCHAHIKATPTLTQLHWLPVAWQLEVRDTAMAAWTDVPQYICVADSQLGLTSTLAILDIEVRFRTATGQCSFVYRAVRIWEGGPQTQKFQGCFLESCFGGILRFGVFYLFIYLFRFIYINVTLIVMVTDDY